VLGRRFCLSSDKPNIQNHCLAMKRNQPLTASLLAGAILASLSLPAAAGVEFSTALYGSSADPLVLGGPDLPASLPLEKFNTALGNLTGIELTLTSDVNLQAQVFNATGATASFTGAQASATLTLNAPGSVVPTLTLSTTPFSDSVAAGASAVGPQTLLSASDVMDIPSADFSAYEYSGGGSSSLSANLTGTPCYVGNGPAGLFFGGSASTYGTVEIQYQYSSNVPDVGALLPEVGLLLCGFAAMKKSWRAN
jgi:hypothetical protein